MSLTNTQKNVLAAAIRANPEMWTPPSQQDMENDAIANWFNSPSEPTAYAWKRMVGQGELKGEPLASDIETLTYSRAQMLAFYVNGGSLDATQANTRQGLASVFEGTQSLSAVMDVCKRPATRLKQLFSETAGDALISDVYGYTLTAYEVSDALFGDR